MSNPIGYLWSSRDPVGYRLPTTPGESDYPIDVVVSTGYNGDEVYGLVLFTGVPMGMVSFCDDNRATEQCDPRGEYKWDHLEMLGENWDWPQIYANFLVHIDEANEDFVEEVMEIGLHEAFEGENCGDGHALIAFTQQVADCMYKTHPELCFDPHARGSGW